MLQWDTLSFFCAQCHVVFTVSVECRLTWKTTQTSSSFARGYGDTTLTQKVMEVYFKLSSLKVGFNR